MVKKNKCKHRVDALEYFNDKVGKCLDCGTTLTSYFPLSDEDEKLIDEIDKKYKTGPYAPFLKRYREDIISWVVALGIIIAIPALISIAIKYFAVAMVMLVGTLILLIGYAVKLMVQYMIFGDK